MTKPHALPQSNLQLTTLHPLTIIIPTFDEAPNILPLTRRLAQVFTDRQVDILFVDDSLDTKTVDAIEEAKRHFDSPTFRVMYCRRKGEQRWGGLSGAVTDGMNQARTSFVAVMDGDLQHPPETLPAMLALMSQGFDLVIASRYCLGGSGGGLSGLTRHVVSWLSTWLAKMLFPRALRRVTDPMTGFFAVNLEVIDLRILRPQGFKILLEIVIRHRGLRATEVPLAFADRLAGKSKGTLKQGWEYLCHLLRLRLSSMRTQTPGSTEQEEVHDSLPKTA